MKNSATVFDQLKLVTTKEPYSDTNPNNIRALYGTFSNSNYLYFHEKTGKGYDFFTDEILRIDDFNQQLSARLMQSFSDWRKFDKHNKKHMSIAIKKVLNRLNISKNLYEISDKILNG